MESDYFFTKLCWVCLAEENDMQSIIDKDLKIYIDNRYSPVSLFEMLSYVLSPKIFFINGPYLICNNCKNQACAAYKFKKRCELSYQIYHRCGLVPCEGDADFIVKEVPSEKIFSDPFLCVPENDTENFSQDSNNVNSVETPDEKDESLVQVELQTIKDEISMETSSNKNLSVKSKSHFTIYLENSFAEGTKLPQVTSKKVLCTMCGLQKSRSCIRQHMLRHANVRNHICVFCQKKFNDKGNLKVHMRIHTGEHPYVCNICGKAFIQASGLKIHKRMHDNVRPYKCHICSYSTRASTHLQLHIKRHNGIKNYHCYCCDYSACSKSELRHHIAKHSNEKSHICKTCGKGFTRYKVLKTHEKSHSGVKPHMCEFCGRGFTQAHSLRSHLKTIHNKMD